MLGCVMEKSGDNSYCKWTAIVLTCHAQNTQAFQKELELRRDRGDIDKDVILLTIEDPKSQVGSGGATLNALLVVVEHISAKEGYTVVNSDILNSCHILIIHMGRSFPYDPCGRTFASVPLISNDPGCPYDSLVCNMDLLLDTMTCKIARFSPSGVWVCSSDMFLGISSHIGFEMFEGVDACVVTVPGTLEYAKNHGIYKIKSNNEVENILYRCKSRDAVKEFLLPSGLLPLVAGVVYLSTRVAEKFLAFHVLSPLSSCTYLGQDSGAHPIQLSLFFDFMLAMCSGVTEEAFIAGGSWGGGEGNSDCGHQTVCAARRLIWRQLNKFKIKALLLEGQHSYMDLLPKTHRDHLLTPVFCGARFSFTKRCHVFLRSAEDVDESAVVINSIIETKVKVRSGAVIKNCHLGGQLEIGDDSMVGGLNLEDMSVVGVRLKSEIFLQVYRILFPAFGQDSSHRVFVVLGINDDIQSCKAFCNEDFSSFLDRTGITSSDLWDSSVSDVRRTLSNARLFPFLHLKNTIGFVEIVWLLQGTILSSVDDSNVLQRWRSCWRLSLEEIMSLLDVQGHLDDRRKLFFDVGSEIVRDTLMHCKDNGLNNLFRSAVNEGYANKILDVLDDVGSRCESAGVAARTLASIADVLGAMSKGEGGLRSGPASNGQWQSAFQLLENGEIAGGLKAMATERSRWITSPNHIVRAARHYEGAAQILIRHAVMSARSFIQTRSCDLAPLNKWVTVECPARIDIAGGWSDTPPITYEHGGAVLDAAVTVDGKKPIGAKVRRIESYQLILHIENDETIILSELESLKDYNQPNAPGALLKAAIICAEIIQYPSDQSLSCQLQKYNGGFEIFTWSNLPHGSGLGTSSILAGALMAALWRSSGKSFDINSLNHAVLHLEQLLTTGGGWQDQVGGLTPGIKVGHSRAALPLRIDMTFLEISRETIENFSSRLLLVYTGKTRLARNLLQNVIRNWYARNPEIVSTEDNLVANVWTCAKAFELGDLETVGRCFSDYWQQKKVMAPGCEPEAVARMMDALRSDTFGMCMAGAGGGGFLYLLTKQPNAIDHVRAILGKVQGIDNAEVYDANVDSTGLTLTLEDAGCIQVPIMFSDQQESR